MRDSDRAEFVVRVVDADNYVDETATQAAADPESDDARDVRRGLALFGLMPLDADRADLASERYSRLGAFFDSETGVITFLDRNRSLDDPWDVALLLHEIIHAVQAAEAGQDARSDTTFEALLARGGMTEGDAVLYQDLATLFGYGLDADGFDWDATFANYKDRRWALGHSTSAPYMMALPHFSYAFGGDFVNRAWREGGNDAVKRLVANPPNSTREILAGFGAAPPPNGAWREDPDDVGYPMMPAGYEPVVVDHLGTWLFEIAIDGFSERTRAFDDRVDSGFSGDVFTVHRAPGGADVVATWRLRFDSVDQATPVFRQVEGAVSLSWQDGRDLVLVESTDPSTLPSTVEGMTWGPVPGADEVGPASAISDVAPTGPGCR